MLQALSNLTWSTEPTVVQIVLQNLHPKMNYIVLPFMMIVDDVRLFAGCPRNKMKQIDASSFSQCPDQVSVRRSRQERAEKTMNCCFVVSLFHDLHGAIFQMPSLYPYCSQRLMHHGPNHHGIDI